MIARQILVAFVVAVITVREVAARALPLLPPDYEESITVQQGKSFAFFLPWVPDPLTPYARPIFGDVRDRFEIIADPGITIERKEFRSTLLDDMTIFVMGKADPDDEEPNTVRQFTYRIFSRSSRLSQPGLVTPADGAIIQFPASVPFAWETPADREGLSNYALVVDGQVIQGYSPRIVSFMPQFHKIGPGLHSWTVIAENIFGNASAAQPRTFVVQPVGGGTATFPGSFVARGPSFDLDPFDPQSFEQFAGLFFEWGWNLPNAAGAGQAIFQMAQYILFVDGQPVQNELATDRIDFLGTRVDIPRLNVASGPAERLELPMDPGTHFWWVVAVDAAGNALASTNALQYSIHISPPGSVEPIAPLHGETVSSSRPTLEWNFNEGQNRPLTTFLVSVDERVYTVGRRNNFTVPVDLTPGPHIWSVEGVDGNGIRTAPTTPQLFEVAPPRLPAQVDFELDRRVLTAGDEMDIAVRVRDQQGQPLEGVAVSFTQPQGSGVLVTPTATTNAQGFASVRYLASSKSEILKIRAGVGTLTAEQRLLTLRTGTGDVAGLSASDNGRWPDAIVLGNRRNYVSRGSFWGEHWNANDAIRFAGARRGIVISNEQIYHQDFINLKKFFRDVGRGISRAVIWIGRQVSDAARWIGRQVVAGVQKVGKFIKQNYKSILTVGANLLFQGLGVPLTVDFTNGFSVGIGYGFGPVSLGVSVGTRGISGPQMNIAQGFQVAGVRANVNAGFDGFGLGASALGGRVSGGVGTGGFRAGVGVREKKTGVATSLTYHSKSGFGVTTGRAVDHVKASIGSSGMSVVGNLHGQKVDQWAKKGFMHDMTVRNVRAMQAQVDWSGKFDYQFKPADVLMDWGREQVRGLGANSRLGQWSRDQWGKINHKLSGWTINTFSYSGVGPVRLSQGNLGLGLPDVKGLNVGGRSQFPKAFPSGVPDAPAPDAAVCEFVHAPQPSRNGASAAEMQGVAAALAAPLAGAEGGAAGAGSFHRPMLSVVSKIDGEYRGVRSLAGLSYAPVNTQTGNLYYQVEDLYVPGRDVYLQVMRIYNSHNAQFSGPLGRGWTHNYAMQVDASNPMRIRLVWADGSIKTFERLTDGTYRSPPACFSRLSALPDGRFRLVHKFGSVYEFGVDGRLTVIVDPNQNTVQLGYDGQARLIRLTDPAGRVATFAYDAAGRIASLRDPDGRERRYVYDGTGHLIRVEGPGTDVAHYQYDGAYNLVRHDDPRSQTGRKITVYEYDEFHRVVKERDAQGRTLQTIAYSIADDGTITSLHRAGPDDPNQQPTIDAYDSQGRWVKRVDAPGRAEERVTEMVWDDRPNLLEVREPGSRVTRFSYDERGNELTVTDPDGRVVARTYDSQTNALRSERTPGGSFVQFGYDSRGNLTSVTDPVGAQTMFRYDVKGQLAEAVAPDGGVTRLDYDAAGHLTSVTDPEGGTRTYEYDTLGRLVRTADEVGNPIAFTWADNQAIARITYPDGGVWQAQYDARGNLIREIHEDGGAVTYAYSPDDLLTTITDPMGDTMLLEYDTLGQLVSQTDGREGRTTLSYDGLGRVVTVRDPAGVMTRLEYTAAGLVKTMIGPTEERATFDYDGRGRVTRSESAAGIGTIVERDIDGNVRALVDPAGNRTAFAYDRAGQVLSVTDAEGAVQSFSYDLRGNLTDYRDPRGGIWNFAYDQNAVLRQMTSPGGRIWRFEPDAAGRVIRTVAPGGRILEVQKVSWQGFPEEVVDPNGGRSRYLYDKIGNLVGAVDSLGRVTQFEYDKVSQVVAETDPAGRRTVYGYDPNGNLTRVGLPNATQIQLGYDAVNQPVTVTLPDGAVYRFQYDAVGRLVGEADPLGGRWSYAYDQLDRMTEERSPAGSRWQYAYDANDNPIREIGPHGAEVSYHYDRANRMIALSDPFGNRYQYSYDSLGNMVAVSDPSQNTYRFTFDADGLLTMVADPIGRSRRYQHDEAGNLVRLANGRGKEFRFSYDKLNLLNSIEGPGGGKSVYVRDVTGRVTTVLDPEGRATRYTYDESDRLTQAEVPDGSVRRFTYDEVGNVIRETGPGGTTVRQYDKANRLILETDPLGRTTRFTYDPAGNRTRVTDPAGRETQLDFDLEHRLIKVRAPDGGMTEFAYDAFDRQTEFTQVVNGKRLTTRTEYDALGHEVRITNPKGETTEFVYDALGRRVRSQDALGRVTAFTYDTVGQVLAVTDPAGGVTRHGYDQNGNLLSVADPNGGVEKTEYDDEDRVAASIDAAGSRTEFRYDRAGDLVATIDSLGRETHREIDAMGRIVASRDALGRVTRVTYDNRGNRESIADPLDRVRRFEYDAAGQLVKQVDPPGGMTVFEYDSAGNKVRETDPGGHTTPFAYDAVNRLVAITDPFGQVRRFEYDEAGRKASEISADGGRTTFEYDEAGRTTVVTDPLGRVTRLEYDAAGQRVARVDTAGRRTAYRYDGAGRLVEVVDPAGGVWRYTYRPDGMLEAITDANGHVTRLEWDPAHRLVAQTDGEGHTTRFEYDAVGNRVRVVKADGTVLEQTHDKGDRLVLVKLPGGGEVTYSYNAGDELTRATFPGGEARYEYDTGSRLVRVEQPAVGVTWKYAYDVDGLRTQRQAEGERLGASRAALGLAYTYDAGHRLARVEGAAGALTFARDPVGRRTRIAYPNGVTGTVTYDAAGQVSQIRYARKEDGAVLGRWEYSYDLAGNRATMMDVLGTHRYTYDALDRLTGWTAPDRRRETYAYDAVGNRTLALFVDATEVSYTHDKADRLLAAGTSTYTHDVVGRLRRVEGPGGVRELEYEAFDRVARVVDNGQVVQESVYAPLTTDLRFAPAPLGSRLTKTDGTGETRYLLDQENVAAEVNADGTLRRAYLTTPDIDDMHAVVDEFGQGYQIHRDALGSVELLTDQTGGLVQQVHYDPWGLPSHRNRDKVPFKFTGREWDAAAHLYYSRARTYDPRLGRFLTADPLLREGLRGLDLRTPWTGHRRLYAQANPMRFTDPTGLVVIGFRGAPIRSGDETGVDIIKGGLAFYGITDVAVFEADMARSGQVRQVIERGQPPIIIYGHSWGGHAAVEATDSMVGSNACLFVDLLGTIDSVKRSGFSTDPNRVPRNTRRNLNFYQQTDLFFRGRPNLPEPPAENRLFTDLEESGHTRIDDDYRVRGDLIWAIVQQYRRVGR